MSKEKLTIESVIDKFENEIFEESLPRGNSNLLLRRRACKDIMKNFLKQTRDELIEEFDFSHNEVRYERLHEPLEKVFKQYLGDERET